MTHQVVFLLDVDNTLLDNDRFADDLGTRLEQAFGVAGRDRYWAIYDALRERSGYADYLASLQHFREGFEDASQLLQMSFFMLDYPFERRVYPHVPETIAHLHALGLPVILSDGDVVFQPRKIQRSGLWDACAGRVWITVHKERALDAVQQHYPASHYVMVDDKPELLAALKRVLDQRVTTVLVRQGHYAAESDLATIEPAPDLILEHIGDLRDHGLPSLRRAATARASANPQS